MAEKSNVNAIKEYFGTPENPVEMSELKALSGDDRKELGSLAAAELGWTPIPDTNPPKYEAP